MARTSSSEGGKTTAGARRRWLGRLFGRGPSADPRPTTLADLEPGRRARIRDLDPASPVADRLAHLGLLDGTEVTVVRRALTGDPLEIRAAGFALSLRRGEAAAVLVEVTE